MIVGTKSVRYLWINVRICVRKKITVLHIDGRKSLKMIFLQTIFNSYIGHVPVRLTTGPQQDSTEPWQVSIMANRALT